MKKCISLLLVLCLLLCGCGAPPSAPAEKPAAATPTVAYTPYYTDPALRGLQADVVYSSDAYTQLGRLNNLYGGQAMGLYEALGVADLQVSQLPIPDAGWVQVSLSTRAGERTEVFTLYENNLVAVSHPTEGDVRCTAAPGTYERVLAYLAEVATEQSRYFALSDEHNADDGYHEASYTLYNEKGKAVVSQKTGSDTAIVELVGADGLVRVTDTDGTRLYAPHAGRQSVLSKGPTDVCGDRLAVSDGQGVYIHTLFGKTPLCRIYVAATADNPDPVQGLDFSADGSELHILVRNAAGSLYDSTVSVQAEIDGGYMRMLGDWRECLTPATEKEEQLTAYDILKKLRYKEKELGFLFSGTLLGHLQVGETDYLLCELGHWATNEDGGVAEYETVGFLMVPASLSAGYAAQVEDNELSWNTDDNWFKK